MPRKHSDTTLVGHAPAEEAPPAHPGFDEADTEPNLPATPPESIPGQNVDLRKAEPAPELSMEHLRALVNTEDLRRRTNALRHEIEERQSRALTPPAVADWIEKEPRPTRDQEAYIRGAPKDRVERVIALHNSPARLWWYLFRKAKNEGEAQALTQYAAMFREQDVADRAMAADPHLEEYIQRMETDRTLAEQTIPTAIAEVRINRHPGTEDAAPIKESERDLLLSLAASTSDVERKFIRAQLTQLIEWKRSVLRYLARDARDDQWSYIDERSANLRQYDALAAREDLHSALEKNPYLLTYISTLSAHAERLRNLSMCLQKLRPSPAP